MTWAAFEAASTELAQRARERFVAHRHHVLATLAADGRPRLWGTEVGFRDGEIWLGMSGDSAKYHDLRRDPRCALHCAPVDVAMTAGDVVVEATARLLGVRESADWLAVAFGGQPPEGARVAVLDPVRVRLVTVSGDELVTDAWSPGVGVEHHRRR